MSNTPKWLHRVIELQEKDVVGISDKCTVHDFERRKDDCECMAGVFFGIALSSVLWGIIGLIVYWWMV